MATGSQAVESVRASIETAEGAATAPTRLLYVPQGSVSVQHKVEQSRGVYAWAKFDATHDIYPEIQDLTLVIDNINGTYQDIGFWLSGIARAGSAVPSTVDTSAYSRTVTPVQTSSVVATDIDSFNIEWSSTDFAGTRVWKMPGMVIEDLTINMRKRASGTDTGVTFSLRFRSASKPTFGTAFTSSLSDRAQTLILGQQFAAFVDSTASGLGSTADGNIIESTFHFAVPAVFHDGAIASDAHTSMHRPSPWTSELSIVRKFSDLTEYTAYVGTSFVKTLRAIRLQFEGAIVGGVDAKNTFRLDFVGKHREMSDSPVRRDGLWYQSFDLDGVYDATVLASFKLFTQNSVSASYRSA